MKMDKKKWIIVSGSALVLMAVISISIFAAGRSESNYSSIETPRSGETVEAPPSPEKAEDAWEMYPPGGWVTDFRKLTAWPRKRTR